MSQIPVIFLAFANDRVDHTNYLRNLPAELAGIREALQPAIQAGICELVERANATTEQILDVFQDPRYKDRICIFHYGGHANGFQLLLEDADGNASIAHASGLVHFFAKQYGLQFIFLNGCSSQQQALNLIEAGVSSVVGTSNSIDDGIATQLAIRFYKGLATGINLYSAWQTSTDEIIISKGSSNLRDLYWEGITESAPESSEHFPWEIYFKPGASSMKTWNLPAVAQNHLFGLSEIPKTHHLPNHPYLFFQKYPRAYAEVFFGRDIYIRQLYQLVTDLNAPPIVLFFGLSGAGKSSLLNAGLLPRIEEDYHAIYVRRNQHLGIIQSVVEALKNSLDEKDTPIDHQAGITEIEHLIQKIDALSQEFSDHQIELNQLKQRLHAKKRQWSTAHTDSPLVNYWHKLEQKTGKPLVLLVDQLEEAFLFNKDNSTDELDDFLNALKKVFGNRIDAPRGRIVLTYRKEFAPELEGAFNQLELPYSKTFLLQLTRAQVKEVILGLTSKPALQKKYNLRIEPSLPTIIADDLLEDTDSPVAPILQILLTKMWERANTLNPSAPELTVKLYQALKSQGLLMDDFLQQQLGKLAEKNPQAVNSGLALDILFFHTNKMGHAIPKSTEDVLSRYHGREEETSQLLVELEELYLLNSIAPSVRKLSHDTLSLLVRQQYGESILPGQRASRIMHYKWMELSANPETLLSSGDVYAIRQGLHGMRTLSKEEHEFLDKSEREIKRKEIFQTRKETRIAVLETENQEQKAEVFLKRVEEKVNEERNQKYDRSIAYIIHAYNKYPEHSLSKRLVYSLIKNTDCMPTMQENASIIEQSIIPDLAPEDEPVQLVFPTNEWQLKVSFPSRIVVANQYGYDKAEKSIPIPDYGIITHVSFSEQDSLFAIRRSDGKIQLFDQSLNEILSLGEQDETSPYFYSGAIFIDNGQGIAFQANNSLVVYHLDPNKILNTYLTERPLTPREIEEI